MLNQFTPAHLEFAYRWETNAPFKNPSFITYEDKSLLNRNNGYEMLHFISSLAKSWDWDDADSFLQRTKQLEGIIIDELPAHIVTYAEIKKWIESTYEVR